MAIFAGISLAVVVLPLAAARLYQQQHLRRFLRAYVGAPRDRLPIEATGSGARTLLQAPALWGDTGSSAGVRTQYVNVRVSPAACPAVRLPLTFRYVSVDRDTDFSYDRTIDFLPSLPVDLFFPAYRQDGAFTFAGIETAPGFERCVEAIERVRNVERFPLLISLTLTPGWEQSPLYQRLAAWELPERTAFPSLQTLPPALTVKGRTLYKEAPPPPVLWRTAIVRDEAGSGWTVRGTPPSPEWPLLEFAAERRRPDDRFVVEGEVVRGGITIGLVSDHRWTGDSHLTFTRPGRFFAVLAPSAEGDYGVLWENGLGRSWFLSNAPGPLIRLAARFRDFNDVRITKARWIPQH